MDFKIITQHIVQYSSIILSQPDNTTELPLLIQEIHHLMLIILMKVTAEFADDDEKLPT